MRTERLLIAGVFVVALVVVLAVLLPGLSAPQPPDPGPTQPPTPAPTPTPAPVPGNGTYVNATYGYAVTCPEGWFYTESGESVWFSSPDKHEEVRVNTNPLSTQGDVENVLEALNATYAENLKTDIGAEWVSTEEISLDGVPAYESVFSVPIVDEDRYTFVIRYGVNDGVIYSVMHTVFPPEYDVYNVDAAPTAESFRFL
ncbi:PsbP-related protein [Methanoculleus chikugoensis]|uniref:PsbP C-terminal domain-containing protein n=1 Tax=Methanoculleus chikugoensis TaxID=118126 RepID=A0ABM7H8S2_9EURY|nr:hypothetical protein [Methanoculleus chikugoensis]BBL69079.1 hypothetical protein MchiMG62_22600 [Methanoculleus chikugoensis]